MGLRRAPPGAATSAQVRRGGRARAVEVTDGANGWHVHLHVLLCFREQVTVDLARAALGPGIVGRWNRALQMALAVETYEESALGRWWEWEAASDGRRQVTWSTGRRDLRALAGLGRESTDEEIAEEDQNADERIYRDVWERIIRDREETDLLVAAEQGGIDGARLWLTARGIGWFTAPPRVRPTGEVMRPGGRRDGAHSVRRLER